MAAKIRRSLGQVKLAMAGSTELVAKKLHRSPGVVRTWRTGERNPQDRTRLEIHEKFPDISPADWDVPAGSLGRNASRTPETEDGPAVEIPEGADPEALARAQLAMIERDLRTLRDFQASSGDSIGSITEISRMHQRLAGAQVQLSRIVGGQLTERAVLMSAPFRRIVERLVAALEPWPDALRAAAAALEADSDLPT
jgi:hypothetical protein